jgi:DnaK suppressor protein
MAVAGTAGEGRDWQGMHERLLRDEARALLAQARDRLDDIRAVLGRPRSGGYGLCERCGQPIAVERPEARPAARTYVAYASRRY